MVLPAVYVLKMINAADAIRMPVLIKIGVTTEGAQLKRVYPIAMNVMKIVKRDCLTK